MRRVQSLVLYALFAALQLTHSRVAGQSPGERLLAAKQTATEANFRNDQSGLRDAIARLDALAVDPGVGARALYWAGWSRWMLAASEFEAKDMPAAIATLEAAVAAFRRALEKKPDDVETLAILAWALNGLAFTDQKRFNEILPEMNALRERAVRLGPENPRVVVMDASLMFWTPPERGGGQARAVDRWLDGMKLLDAEKVTNPVEPAWGRALFEGWLAWFYINMTPPRKAEARQMAARALELRPDFWWVATVVMPQIEKQGG
ncbi:MAG: hypothetical protein L0271_09395 [Gemmatimonadetes bacterium]|nr:hypothetical protein [Gemmatimonadota bacterium]